MAQNDLGSSLKAHNPKKVFIQELRVKRMNCDEFNKISFNNACQKLSKELYSSSWQFFYELIQNAEDNDYHEDSIPCVKFILSTEEILIQNNEKGFTPEDIKNITDIGFSNKKKSDQRHDIGENGIGFKSVFAISDKPMIFSNGYHFGFNAKEELGYIMPNWISKIPPQVDLNVTNILLPLNEKGKDLIQNFNPFESETLLFLDKLKKIIIRDDISNKSMIFEKSIQENYITLTMNSGDIGPEQKQKYFIVKQEFKRPLHVMEKKREDTKSSRIELAFPLKENSFKRGTLGRAFSFLPIIGYKGNIGFPFIIQGDFLLTSNRSEIYPTNEWNRWLKSKISEIYLSAIEKFKLDNILQYEFLNTLPNKLTSKGSDKNTFFSEIIDEIDLLINDAYCIMNVEKKWIKPGEAMYADLEIHDIIPNHILEKYLNHSFIHLDFIEKTENPIPIFERLEISQFTVKTLIELLKYEDWYLSYPKDWFVKLYHYLGKKIQKSEINSKDIEFLRIFYLEEDEISNSRGKMIYLRIPDGLKKNIRTNMLYIDEYFYNNIQLDKNVLNSISILFKAQNIHPTTAENILFNGIIPIFHSNSLDQYESEDKREIIIFLKNNYKKLQKESFKMLKSKISLRTTSSLKDHHYKTPSYLYLSKEYNYQIELESLIKISPHQGAELFISKEYLEYDKKGKKEDESRESWKQFFIELGVNELYLPRIKEFHFDDLPQSIYVQLSPELKLKLKHSTIYDYNTPIPFNLSENSYEILKYLAKNWKIFNTVRYISISSKRGIIGSDNKPERQTIKIKASWYYFLTTQQWIPSLNGQHHLPSKIFIPSEELEDFIIGEMPILNIDEVSFDINRNIGFLEALGINCRITIPMVLKSIKILKESGEHDLGKYERLYSYLNKHFRENPQSISKFFSEGDYIFISNTKNQNQERNQKQKQYPQFHNSKDVVWIKESKNDIYHQFVVSVQEKYPHLKHFFVQRLGIREKNNLDKYYQIFDEILQKTEPLVEKEINYIHQFYKDISTEIGRNYSDFRKQPYSNDLKSKAFILTNDGKFLRNSANIFYNDANNLYDLFKSEKEIDFIDVKKGDISLLKEFFRFYKIKSINSQVSVSILADRNESERSDLTILTKNAIPYILRFLYSKNLALYNEIIKKEILTNLLSLKVIEVDLLKVEVVLPDIGKNLEKIIKTSTIPKFFYKDLLYITKNDSRYQDYISLLLSVNFFNEMPGLDDYIGNILQKIETRVNLADLNAYLDDKKIYPISVDERKNLEKFFDQDKMEILFNEFPSGAQEQINKIEKIEESKEKIEEINEKVGKIIDVGMKGEDKKKLEPEDVEKEREIRKIGLYHYNLDRLKKKIGIQGEKFVFESLVNEFKKNYLNYLVSHESDCELELTDPITNSKKISIQWKKSKNGLSNEGYDILLIENGMKKFIEVKSTISMTRVTFPISESEWALAKKEKENYMIYRVSSTLTKDPTFNVIVNPYQKWLNGEIEAKPIELKLKSNLHTKDKGNLQSTKEKQFKDKNRLKDIKKAEKPKKINDKLAVNTENDNQKKKNKLPKLKKEKQSNFTCNSCKKTFSTKNALADHQNATKHVNQEKLTSNKYKCTQCSAVFNLKQEIIAHSQTTGHQIPKKIDCIECGKKFKFEEDLIQHCQDSHPQIQSKEKKQSKSDKVPYEITQIRSIFMIVKDGIKETRDIESLLLFSQENLEKYGISFTDRNRICRKIRGVKDKKVQITLKELKGEIVEIIESLQKISEDIH